MTNTDTTTPAETADTQPYPWTLTVAGQATQTDQESLASIFKGVLHLVDAERTTVANFFGSLLRGDPRDLLHTAEDDADKAVDDVVDDKPAADTPAPSAGTASTQAGSPLVAPTGEPDQTDAGTGTATPQEEGPVQVSDPASIQGLVGSILAKAEADRTTAENALLAAAQGLLAGLEKHLPGRSAS
jgi:hypothetical protein